MLVDHTIIESVTPLQGGKVIAVQVYPHRVQTIGAPALEGARREGGRWYRVTANALRTELGGR